MVRRRPSSIRTIPRHLMAKVERLSASPSAIKAISLLNAQIDIRPILPTMQVPTLR